MKEMSIEKLVFFEKYSIIGCRRYSQPGSFIKGAITQMSSYTIPEATGASIRPRNLLKHKNFLITDFGANESAAPAVNTQAINSAIQAASMEGGTVVVPEGTFHT